MDKRIRELYINLMQKIDNSDKLSCEIQQVITELLKEEKNSMSSLEYGRYRDKVFRIVSEAEENGFVRGFKYAAQLFAECMKE